MSPQFTTQSAGKPSAGSSSTLGISATEPALSLAILVIIVPMLMVMGRMFVKKHRAIAHSNRIEYLEKLWKINIGTQHQ